MPDKYQALRDGVPELIAEAARQGGINTRAQLILDLLAERDGYLAQHDRDSNELRSLCAARDEARKERDSMRKALQAIAESDAPINIVDTMTGPERDMVEIARAALSLK